ncbi:unnamed protein product [Clavelina lepadiformis]|uniref:Sushi domain-containing protein n=1 Tax=Clavelina lepadiformis TaxID=159417 RepID=A0ABP0FDR7_CLALP
MSCAEGYEFKARNNQKPENMTHSVTLYCGDDGNWEPDANDYICVEIICDQPPDVAMTDDTRVMIANAKYDYDDEINYHCNPGYYLQYIFSLHSLNYKLCLYEGEDGLIYASKSTCISAKALQFRWAEVEESRHPMQLREAASGRCLAAQDIPTESASFKPLTLQICNGSDVRHNWFCGDHEESYLILGLNASQEFYISIHMESNVVHTTKTSTEATEFVARKDKLMHLEIDVCRFRPRFFTQRTHCFKLGGWSPDPSLIKCEPIVCPDPPHVAYAKLKTDEAIFGYGSSVKYICNPGYEYLLERNTYVSRCSDLGTWVPDPTQLPCKKIRCPHYQLPAGAFVSSGNVANNLYNSKLTVSCQRGSQFKEGLSSMIVRCGPQKKWSPSHTVKECHLLKCLAPPDLANSTWTSLKPFLFNSLARYVCDNGHWIERGVTWKDTYCSETGLWIPDPERTIKCKIVECEDPGDVPNTLRHDVARPTDAFTFGSVVMYKCVTGRWFSRDLVKVSITCRDDANWYPPVTSLYCKEMTCLNPEPLPRYSFIIGYDHALGATLTVMCEPGYRIGGSAVSLTNNTEIQCMKTQKWEPDLSTIICHPLSCGEPGKVKFAHRLNSSNSFNSFAQYMCVAGYWMQPGMSSRLSQCKADGTWQPDPQSFVCKVVNCGHPGTFYNALSSVVKSGTLYGALVQIKCRDGYWTSHSYQKSVTLQCSDEGLWEPPPEGIHCIDVKCHEPANIVHAVRRLLPPHISSQVTSSDPITGGLFYTRGVRFEFRCDDGYEFAPQQYSIISSCTSHGNWSIQTKFLNCSLTSCPPPNAIIHGYVSENEGTSFESYFINSTFTYKCDEGFWFENKTFDMEVTCLKSGKWNRDIEYLFCFRVECKNPEPIDHGYFVISGTTYAHTTRYFCDDGYIESTPSVSTCSSSGDWLPSPPAIHCQAVDCGELPTIPQASASDRNASVLYGSVVEYTCDTDHYFALGLQAINVTCDKNGKWTNSNKRCIDFRDFECRFPPGIPNSFYHSVSSQSVSLHCDPGYFLRGDDANTTSQLMTCNGTGHWDPSELECVELQCSTPSVQGPHTVMSRTSSAFNYSSVVTINCDSGHTLTLVPSGGPKQWLTSINVTCNQHAEWFPSLADIECRRVNCSAPPSVENAEVTYNSTELLDQASYHCLKNMSFGDKINKTVNCSADGTWQPNPATFECSYHKCRVPVPPQYSTLSIKGQDYLNGSAVIMLPELRVTCNTGYRVAGQANFTLSVSIECNPLGEWVSDPNLIECEEVTCDSLPNVSFILVPDDITAMAPFNYKDELTYQCPSGQWFSPENVTHQMLRCHWDTTWQPSLANAECVGITCDYPPPVEHASLRGDDTRVGAEWTYTCDFGYRISAGVRGRATKCQTNGQWLPSPNSPQLRCEVIACDVPPVLPNIVNGTLLVLKPGQAYFDFREGVNFTYSCETGFWMSDGEIKHTSKNVMCLDGEWVPSPHTAIRCVIVVCDIAHPVRGARTDGIEHVYMSNITYSCARGQHFGYQRRRRLNVTCREDGRWHPNPHALWCSDVICKDLDLEGATKEQGGLRLDSTVIHTCPPTTWFGPQVSEIAATCDEDGRWSPSLEGKKCEDVSCGEPALDHILLQHNDFTYTSQVELECLGGYNLFPSTDPPVLMCDVSGSWYPDPRNYKCKPIECSLPRYIRHATVIGNNTYNSTVIVQCDPGFYIRRGTNWLEAVCMHDSTWSEDINSVFCIPLECLPLKQLPHSKLIRDTTLPSQAYNAVVKYQCHHGYWVDELVYSQSVRCNEIGMWEPPINFTCYEIKCKYPPNKRNSQIVIEGRVNLTEYPINSGMRYRCHNRSWVSAQHALAEWAFTGDVQVRMICSIKGMWKPHPDSFACREIEEGPLPVAYPRGLDQSQVKYEAWAEMEQILPNQILSHPYLQPVPIGQRGWYGGSSLKSSMVQDMNAVPSERTASLLWDGKISTMWRPNRTEDRHYSFTLFLGGLYNVEGIELVTLNNRQEVLFIRANFSHDGKFFNDSIDTSKSRGRTGRVSDAISPIVVEKVPSSSNIILTITGFSHVAKFITITVTATRDLSYPPIIRELRFLGTPVRWEVVYPLDFLTTPLFTCIVSICFAVALLFARRWDESDKKKVQFGWDVSDCDNSSVDECYVIRLTCNDQLQAKHLVCRLVGDAANTELVLVNAPFKDKQLALLVPGSCGNLIRFEVGYVANDRPVLPANNVGPEIGVKIAELSPDKSLFGTLPWALNEASVSLVENEPISIRFFNKNTSRRSTLAKIQALDPLRWALYHIFTDHIFYTVFFKDFISQTTRVFRLLITFIGCCAALTISSILYKITHTMVFFESITSFGLGGISAFSSLPILVGLMLLFIHFPVYVPPEAEVVSEFVLDEKLVESEKREFISKASNEEEEFVPEAGDSVIFGEKGNFLSVVHSSFNRVDDEHQHQLEAALLGQGDMASQDSVETAASQIDPDLESLLEKFKHLGDFDQTSKSKATTDVSYPSITDTQDTCMLPANYRKSLYAISEPDQSSICTSDLEAAYMSRTLRGHRRTRSAPAVLQYLGPVNWDSILPYVCCSLPHISDVDDAEILSCASMWSNESLVNKWHRLHRSVDQPIDDLFGQLDPKLSESHFSWHDPTYRRIPSDITKRGFLGSRSPPVGKWLKEFHREKAAAPIIEFGSYSDGEDSRPVVDTQSATTQIPLLSRMSASTQYPTGYALSWKRYSVYTQKPSSYVLSKNVRVQYPSLHVLERLPSGKRSSTSVESLNLLSSRRFEDREGFMSRKVPGDCTPSSSDTLVDEDDLQEEIVVPFEGPIQFRERPGEGNARVGAGMVLRNRSHKKVVAFSTEHSRTLQPRLQPEDVSLVPSAGAFFSTSHGSSLYSDMLEDDDSIDVKSDTASHAHDIEPSVKSGESLVLNQTLAGSLKASGPCLSSMKKKNILKKKLFTVASPASALYKVTRGHDISFCIVCLAAACSPFILLGAGIDTIEKSADIAYLFFTSLVTFFVATLSLEAVLRWNIYRKWERLSLAYLRPIVHEGSSECGSASDLSSLTDTVDDK